MAADVLWEQIKTDLASVPPVFDKVITVLDEIEKLADVCNGSCLSKLVLQSVDFESIRRDAHKNNLDVETIHNILKNIFDTAENFSIVAEIGPTISSVRNMLSEGDSPNNVHKALKALTYIMEMSNKYMVSMALQQDRQKAESLYFSASMKMRSGEFRAARSELQETLRIFHTIKDQRSSNKVRSKLMQLDAVEMQQYGPLISTASRNAIHTELPESEEHRIFMMKLLELQREEDTHLIRARSERMLAVSSEPARLLTFATPEPAPLEFSSSFHSNRSPILSPDGGGPMGAFPTYADVAFTDEHAELLRLHADGEGLVAAALESFAGGQLLEAHAGFQAASHAFDSAGLPDLARNADDHAALASHTVRVVAESAAARAAAACAAAEDWDAAAYRDAADTLRECKPRRADTGAEIDDVFSRAGRRCGSEQDRIVSETVSLAWLQKLEASAERRVVGNAVP